MRKKKPSHGSRDYEIGKGKPPVAARWKPGQCGNPKGRPKKAKGTTTMARDELERSLPVIVNGRKKHMSVHDAAFRKLKDSKFIPRDLSLHNQLSQLNVIQQLEHLRSYPLVADRVDQGKLRLHAWWFDIAKADVYMFDSEKQSFCIFDETRAEAVIAKEPV